MSEVGRVVNGLADGPLLAWMGTGSYVRGGTEPADVRCLGAETPVMAGQDNFIPSDIGEHLAH